MDTDSYDIHVTVLHKLTALTLNDLKLQQAALTPHSVQPIPRGGAGKKNVEPIEFNLTEHK